MRDVDWDPLLNWKAKTDKGSLPHSAHVKESTKNPKQDTETLPNTTKEDPPPPNTKEGDHSPLQPSAGSILREVLVVFAAATAIGASVFHLGRVIPFIGRHVADVIAITFYALPVMQIWRRNQDLWEYGFNLQKPVRSLVLVASSVLVTFPLFFVAFLLFYETVCGPFRESLGILTSPGGTLCRSFRGLEGSRLIWPGGSGWEALTAFFTQLVAVAIPEEFFFRGYLQGRLREAFPAKHLFLGVPVGSALLLASVLFAMGHFLIDLDPRRLAVFFPALVFGWMREASGSIAPGAVFHALCNLLSDALHRSFFQIP